MVAHFRMNVKSHMWDVRLFHFSFSSLLSTIPPNPIFFLLFFSLFLPICSQGQTFSGPFFYILNHTKKFTLVFWPISWYSLWWDWHVPRIYGQVVGANFETCCLHSIGRMCQYLPAFTLCIVLQNGGPWYLRPHSWLQSACVTHHSLYHVVPSVTFELHLCWVGTVYGF